MYTIVYYTHTYTYTYRRAAHLDAEARGGVARLQEVAQPPTITIISSFIAITTIMHVLLLLLIIIIIIIIMNIIIITIRISITINAAGSPGTAAPSRPPASCGAGPAARARPSVIMYSIV